MPPWFLPRCEPLLFFCFLFSFSVLAHLVFTLTFVFIPDTPIQAKWLSEGETVALLRHVSESQTGMWSTTVNLKQVREPVCDVQLWLLTLTTVLVQASWVFLGLSSNTDSLLRSPSQVVW